METAEARALLYKQAKEKVDAAERTIRCLYPWVLVKVLPKDQMYKGILYLPDAPGKDKSQNKPVAEGIVLSTWHPFFTVAKKTRENLLGEPVVVWTQFERKSNLKPGDHILFPHWAGQPAGELDAKEFRLIQEFSSYQPSPEPSCIVEHEDEPIKTQLEKLISQEAFDEAFGYDVDIQATANRIMREYYVIPKNSTAKTLSGK